MPHYKIFYYNENFAHSRTHTFGCDYIKINIYIMVTGKNYICVQNFTVPSLPVPEISDVTNIQTDTHTHPSIVD